MKKEYNVDIKKRINKDKMVVQAELIKPSKPTPPVPPNGGNVARKPRKAPEWFLSFEERNNSRLDRIESRLDGIDTRLNTVIKLNNLKTE
jgi:hypothetical protein